MQIITEIEGRKTKHKARKKNTENKNKENLVKVALLQKSVRLIIKIQSSKYKMKQEHRDPEATDISSQSSHIMNNLTLYMYDNLNEMDTFLIIQKLPKHTEGKRENLNTSMSMKETEEN